MAKKQTLKPKVVVRPTKAKSRNKLVSPENPRIILERRQSKTPMIRDEVKEHELEKQTD